MTQEEITIALDDAEHNTELDCDVNELRPVLKQTVILIESLTADRDAWKARAEKSESSRDNWKANYYDAIEKLEAMEERAVKSAYWQERAERAEAELKEAVFDLSGHCEYCAFRNDCAKHDNNDSSAGFTWWTDCDDWEWRGARKEGTK